MSKFTLEQKFAAVQEYLFKGKDSYRSPGKKLDMNHRDIQKWVFQYEAQGIEGLFSRYTNYSGEFKMDVLNFMNETGTSLLETTAIYIFQLTVPFYSGKRF